MDNARKQTDRILIDLERRIENVFSNSSKLKNIQKKYMEYMRFVEKSTQDEYNAYTSATGHLERFRLKKIYSDKVKKLTLYSKEYRRLENVFTRTLAEVNQQAVDLANAEMVDIYLINYNQVAVNCKEVGIEVINGKE